MAIEIRVEATGAVAGLLGEAPAAADARPASDANLAAGSAPDTGPAAAAGSVPDTGLAAAAGSVPDTAQPSPAPDAQPAAVQPDPGALLPWPDNPQTFSLDQVADVLWGDPGKSMLMHHLQQNRAVIGGTYIPPTRGVIVFKSEPPDLRVHHFCRLCTVRAFPHQTDPDERHGPLCPFYRGHRPHIHDEHCAENPLCLPLYRGPLDEGRG